MNYLPATLLTLQLTSSSALGREFNMQTGTLWEGEGERKRDRVKREWIERYKERYIYIPGLGEEEGERQRQRRRGDAMSLAQDQ